MIGHISRQGASDRSNRQNFIVQEQWGQPPASHYRFKLDGNRMIGTPVSNYMISFSEPEEMSDEAELLEELRCWDILSDEALISFEDDLE